MSPCAFYYAVAYLVVGLAALTQKVSACGGYMLRGRVADVPGIPMNFVVVARSARIPLGLIAFSHTVVGGADLQVYDPFESEDKHSVAFLGNVLLDGRDVLELEGAEPQEGFLDEVIANSQARAQFFDDKGPQVLGLNELNAAIVERDLEPDDAPSTVQRGYPHSLVAGFFSSLDVGSLACVCLSVAFLISMMFTSITFLLYACNGNQGKDMDIVVDDLKIPLLKIQEVHCSKEQSGGE